MQSIKELAAKLNRQVTQGLAQSVRAMPADRQSWKPLEMGRNALDQARECAAMNLITADTLRARQMPQDLSAEFEKHSASLVTGDDILAALEKSGRVLTKAIEEMPEEALAITVRLPWDPEPTTLAEIMFLSYWNTTYHVGQVNYIQTLYGDNEMH